MAVRYSECCKARTGSAGELPAAVGLAETALTGHLHDEQTHRRSSGPSLTGGYVVRSAQAVLRPPPTPFRPATHFPRSSVIERHAPATQSADHRAGEGLTSSRRHYLNVPSPIRRGVLQRLHIQVFSAFHGLHPVFGGSALPAPHPQRAGPLTTPQASLHATDRSVAPLQGHSTLGFDPAGFPTKPPVRYQAS